MKARVSIFFLGFLGAACAGMQGTPGTAPTEEHEATSDAQAVFAQEAGEAPAPQGPCPARSVAGVLENPRAAVHRTAFGIAYCILEEGPKDGLAPRPTDTVRVHYSGYTPEGDVFDSSIERGEPTEFPLDKVIRGWTEGLQLMTPGDKARFWIPGDMAYGKRVPGEPAGSPPKGTLIFEIELLEILPAPVKAAPPPATPTP
jgi:FKBP-type peptidyl-prolyl cis-trans isomerase